MTLARGQLQCDLKVRMAKAVEQEASQVEELRREARTLTVRKLDYRLCKTVAPLATDEGENRLSFCGGTARLCTGGEL